MAGRTRTQPMSQITFATRHFIYNSQSTIQHLYAIIISDWASLKPFIYLYEQFLTTSYLRGMCGTTMIRLSTLMFFKYTSFKSIRICNIFIQ